METLWTERELKTALRCLENCPQIIFAPAVVANNKQTEAITSVIVFVFGFYRRHKHSECHSHNVFFSAYDPYTKGNKRSTESREDFAYNTLEPHIIVLMPYYFDFWKLVDPIYFTTYCISTSDIYSCNIKANILSWRTFNNSKQEQTLLPSTDINIFNYKKKNKAKYALKRKNELDWLCRGV